jgi:hypothetical protein
MFSVITNIYNKKTKGPTLMELFTATEIWKKFKRRSMCAPRVTRHTSIRYSSSCHTRVNMGASIHFTASGRNVNNEGKNLLGNKFLSCSFYLYGFRKYVSYGFPVINFCNPGVHYEKPCIYSLNMLSEILSTTANITHDMTCWKNRRSV